MDASLFFGGSAVAAFVAGMVALFAPCCISVMLPAYFASSFQNRGVLVAMTFLFAAGVATVILPIALGINLVRAALSEAHALIYLGGGLLMALLGGYVLLGGKIHLPMPSRPAGGGAGPWAVYTLGVFSGVASACCAPVLAGVVALSSVASSFGLALGLGAAYVFGMVAPLFLISLLWESRDWRRSGLFRQKRLSWRLGRLKATLTPSELASGVLLVLIGLGMGWAGLAYDGMAAPTGWQAVLATRLQSFGEGLTQALAWIPGWAGALALAGIVGLLALRALRQVGADAQTNQETKEGRYE